VPHTDATSMSFGHFRTSSFGCMSPPNSFGFPQGSPANAFSLMASMGDLQVQDDMFQCRMETDDSSSSSGGSSSTSPDVGPMLGRGLHIPQVTLTSMNDDESVMMHNTDAMFSLTTIEQPQVKSHFSFSTPSNALQPTTATFASLSAAPEAYSKPKSKVSKRKRASISGGDTLGNEEVSRKVKHRETDKRRRALMKVEFKRLEELSTVVRSHIGNGHETLDHLNLVRKSVEVWERALAMEAREPGFLARFMSN
jgi:hypothetical protein